MPDAALPETVSIAFAAAVAGRPRTAFLRQYVETGLVETDRTAGGRLVVVLASLERSLGRPITAADYRSAERRLAPARAYQANWRRRHRKDIDDGRPSA
jgi:hypothetical protein